MKDIVIAAGDSLSSLANTLYGSVEKFRELADSNELDIFVPLPVGERIRVPTSEVARQGLALLDENLDLTALKERTTAIDKQIANWIL